VPVPPTGPRSPAGQSERSSAHPLLRPRHEACPSASRARPAARPRGGRQGCARSQRSPDTPRPPRGDVPTRSGSLGCRRRASRTSRARPAGTAGTARRCLLLAPCTEAGRTLGRRWRHDRRPRHARASTCRTSSPCGPWSQRVSIRGYSLQRGWGWLSTQRSGRDARPSKGSSCGSTSRPNRTERSRDPSIQGPGGAHWAQSALGFRATPMSRPRDAVTGPAPTATTRLFVGDLTSRASGDLAFRGRGRKPVQ